MKASTINNDQAVLNAFRQTPVPATATKSEKTAIVLPCSQEQYAEFKDTHYEPANLKTCLASDLPNVDQLEFERTLHELRTRKNAPLFGLMALPDPDFCESGGDKYFVGAVRIKAHQETPDASETIIYVVRRDHTIEDMIAVADAVTAAQKADSTLPALPIFQKPGKAEVLNWECANGVTTEAVAFAKAQRYSGAE